MQRDDERELDLLMRRLADGDRDAFDPLFRALHPRAFRFAVSHLRDEARAADVAQAALVNLFARASEFDPRRPVLPWFYAIVTNELRAATRSAARVHSNDDALASVASDDDPEHDLVDREQAEALQLAIASLDGVSADAIAAVLCETTRPAAGGTAFRKRVSRAYARLRAILGVNG